jgi:penicillin-binding protein 2
MANIMAIVANKGYFHTPHIIKKIGNSNEHSKMFEKKNYTGIEKEYFDMVYDGMQDVLERGTAAGSRVKGINILGKTGTAQNPHGKDHSLFVAFAPRENPKIAIGLMVENGGWGASWAAPIGTLMIEKYLNDTIARKELEKRMFDGVVYPPHYKVGTEFEEKTAKKDSSKTVSKNKKEDNKKEDNKKKKDKKEVSEKKKSSDTETKKPLAEKKLEKGASEKPEAIEKNSPKKGDKDKKKKEENKSDKKSDSSKVKTTKKETVQSKKNTPQKEITPAQIKKDATQIDSTKK